MLLGTFGACLYDVKLLLLCHIVKVCIPQASSVNTQKKQYYQVEVASDILFTAYAFGVPITFIVLFLFFLHL